MPETFRCGHCDFCMPTKWGWGYGFCSRQCYLWAYIPEVFEKDLD